MVTAFEYEAVDHSSKTLLGQISAETRHDAVRILTSRGLTPVTMSPVRPAIRGKEGLTWKRAPSDQDYILTLKQMSLLLSAGVPLITGIETLRSQSIHASLTLAFETLSKALRSGETFSTAFQTALPALPPYVFQLSAAGEAIGDLGPAIGDAAEQMEYEYRTKQDIRNALTYPSILVIAGLGAVLFIFLIVVPRFSAMLASSNEPLPLLSSLVLSIGMTLSENKSIVFSSIIVVGALIVWAGRQPAIRDEIRQRMSSFPILGLWLKESELARWSSMLGTMLRHGVDLIKALDLAKETITIKALRNRVEQIGKMVRGGQSLSSAMSDQDVFSDTALSLVQVGEESGELAHMLKSLSALYDDSGRQRMKRFLLILEPAAIILIGIVIGGIVTAIMLAITSINQVNL